MTCRRPSGEATKAPRLEWQLGQSERGTSVNVVPLTIVASFLPKPLEYGQGLFRRGKFLGVFAKRKVLESPWRGQVGIVLGFRPHHWFQYVTESRCQASSRSSPNTLAAPASFATLTALPEPAMGSSITVEASTNMRKKCVSIGRGLTEG